MTNINEKLEQIREAIENMDDDSLAQKNITEEDLQLLADLKNQINEDQKADSQRYMAIVSLAMMVLYPIVVLAASALGFDAELLVSMSDIVYIAFTGVIAAFFGKEAYMSKHTS